jgi:hypothetical protein
VIDLKTLTPEQRELWRELEMDTVRPSGDQTPAQARRAQEAAFRYACALEGIPLPDVQRSSVQMGRTLQTG